MPDLISLLSNAAMGLSAHRAATATASHNIQNANTPGYSRQRAELVSLGAEFYAPSSFIGLGVQLGTVSQARDRFIEAQITTSLGSDGRSSAHARALESVTALNPESPGGLTHSISDFFAAARELAQNPGDLGLRQAFVGAARRMTTSFNTTSAAIESARGGLDAQLQTKVLRVNDAAANLADINRRIVASGSASPNDLLDARQKAVDELAELTGGTAIPDADGNISFSLPNGTALVSGVRSAVLSTVGDATNRGHLTLQVTLADGSGPKDLGNDRVGGELRGILDARDGAMKTAIDQVDLLAWELSARLNLQHQGGYTMTGLNGVSLFTTPTGEGAAAAFTVQPSVIADPRLVAAAMSNPPPSGDGRNIQAMIAIENSALTGGLNVGQTVAKIVSDFGSTTFRARAEADHDGAMRAQLESMRESVSGVSIDEEMISLTKSQRAYEALLKVISTADQMLENLMQIR